MNLFRDSYNNPFEYFKHNQKNYKKLNSLNKNFKDKKNLYLKYLNTNCHCINLLRYLFGDLKIENKKFNSSGEGLAIFKNKLNSKIIFNNQYTPAKSWKEKNIFKLSIWKDNCKSTYSIV